jgi:hypothetical protein
MKNDSRLPTPMDWLCTVEFIPEDNGEARLFATEIVGHLFGYAQATNTRALALVGDADANAYELLFSFASSEGKSSFCIWFARTRTWGTTTLRMISCHPRLKK